MVTSQRPPTVLVAENDLAVQGLVRRILEGEGYRTVLAANGFIGLLRFHEERGDIDLVVTDIVMPEMGGMVMAHELRASDPDVPVLFMTGYPEFGEAPTVEGPTDFIAKPFDPAEFLEKARQLLRRPLDPSADGEPPLS